MKADNGGCAFPFEGGDNNGNQPDSGMFLRDYFAAKAMQAYLSGEDRDEFGYGEWATASYSMADAMLKARAL